MPPRQVREVDLYNNTITADWDDEVEDEENEADEGVGDDAGNEEEDANEASSDDANADAGVDAEVDVHDIAFDDRERDASDDRLHLPCSHGKTT